MRFHPLAALAALPVAGASCGNDPAWRRRRRPGRPAQGCAKAARKPDACLRWVGVDGVRASQACREACGSCPPCEDDRDWRASHNPKARCRRVAWWPERRCGWTGADGTPASAGCEKACGTCRPSFSLVSRVQSEGASWGGKGAEIVAFDPHSDVLYTTNGEFNRLDAWDLSDLSDIQALPSSVVDLTAYGSGVNSVAVHKYASLSLMAVAMTMGTDPGSVEVFKLLAGEAPAHIQTVAAGANPDMVTFTPDGKKILSANEGDPNDDYTVDPVGDITIIDVDVSGMNVTFPAGGVRTAGFDAFNGQEAALRAQGVRIYGPGASVAQDVEPEYIAVSADSKTAWVTLQENNAFAIVDVDAATVDSIVPLGLKDYSVYPFDASDKDGVINIRTWDNVVGMYQPDAIAPVYVGGKTYIISANEGDSRDYDGFSEETRVGSLTLDNATFADAALQDDENLGRLKTTTVDGDADGDGAVETIYSYGARSFSIWDEAGELVWDSGSMIADITATERRGVYFNANSGDQKDQRSDDKGAEPEGVATGVVDGMTYAFVGLERTGGVLVFDVSDPESPVYVQWLHEGLDDISPEGLLFVSAEDSPSGRPLLVVSHEVTSTTIIYQIG